MLEAAGLRDSSQADALSLQGRILKDRAVKSSGERRSQLFEQAAAAYLRSAGDRRATYPLINAATIAFLNGNAVQAKLLAGQTLGLLESGDYEPETDYWLGATWAEALLLLGDVTASQARLTQAVAETPAAWEDHAATIRQLQLILAHSGGDTDLFEALRPPASLHYSGLIDLPADDQNVRGLIGGAFDEIRPGFVFGALAAGADILIAETALERGAQLHVVLPAATHVFLETSVLPFGEQWVRRFQILLDAAETVDVLEGIGQLSDAAVALGEEVAMGLAIKRARSLASQAVGLRLRRQVDAMTLSETIWRDRGLPVHELVLDQPLRPDWPKLPQDRKQVMLASAYPLPADAELPAGMTPQFSKGAWLLALDNLAQAMALAVALLDMSPDMRLGLVLSVRNDDDTAGDIAALLARAAPQGTICAAYPGVLALELHAPDFPFEAAGELVTEFGDIPIAHYSRPMAD